MSDELDTTFGLELIFPTRYVRVRQMLDAVIHWMAVHLPKQVDRRWGLTTFIFDRLDDLRLAFTRRAAKSRPAAPERDER